jgi:3-methyladenine DNA glycosylase AlkC
MPQKKNAENPNAFKLWMSEQTVEAYANGIRRAHPTFDAPAFLRTRKQLAPLELKARVILLADALRELLPQEYPQALKILTEGVKELEGFALWPAAEFIRRYGREHFDLSFAAMEKLTERFTAEFAVRPYLIENPKRAIRALLKAARSKNVHHRRWASEGLRPRLPWGEKLEFLIRDPSPALEILELLKFDSELYVRKSVSNHLNDIAKDHPEITLQILKRWSKVVPKGFETEFAFIRRQALRTLIKRGHPEALKMLGVTPGDRDLKIAAFRVKTPHVRPGGALEFEFTLKNAASRTKTFELDYAIHFIKKNGAAAPKVFKLRRGEVPGKGERAFAKSHSFRPITTRVYYPGLHTVELRLNGAPAGKQTFKVS